MNKTECKIERLSNLTIGFFLLIFGLMFTLIGIMIVPVIGLFVAIPVLIVAGVFLAAPHSRACAVIAQKTRGALSNQNR
jgi:hypothetical protein